MLNQDFGGTVYPSHFKKGLEARRKSIERQIFWDNVAMGVAILAVIILFLELTGITDFITSTMIFIYERVQG